jgi:hypothetical protein
VKGRGSKGGEVAREVGRGDALRTVRDRGGAPPLCGRGRGIGLGLWECEWGATAVLWGRWWAQWAGGVLGDGYAVSPPNWLLAKKLLT